MGGWRVALTLAREDNYKCDKTSVYDHCGRSLPTSSWVDGMWLLPCVVVVWWHLCEIAWVMLTLGDCELVMVDCEDIHRGDKTSDRPANDVRLQLSFLPHFLESLLLELWPTRWGVRLGGRMLHADCLLGAFWGSKLRRASRFIVGKRVSR